MKLKALAMVASAVLVLPAMAYGKGKPGNMYKHLGETEEERAANFKILNAWVVGEGNKWDMNGIGQRGEMPPITLEQLRRIKAKY